MKMTIVLAVLLCVNAARAGVAAPGPGEIPGNLPLPTFQFSASLSGTNEVPPNSSSATGTVTFTLVANLFTYQVFLPLPLVPVGARIHGPANPGQNAGAVFDLDGPRFVGPDPGTGVAGYAFTGNRSLSGEEVAQLIAGFWYVNVRSAGFPDGELRGQIVLPGPDNDGDGVPDSRDHCPNTPPGAVVDASGCSVVQACSCNSIPRNRARYILCIVHTARQFQRAGLITRSERVAIIRAALRRK